MPVRRFGFMDEVRNKLKDDKVGEEVSVGVSFFFLAGGEVGLTDFLFADFT